jgi:hypothetical protein
MQRLSVLAFALFPLAACGERDPTSAAIAPAESVSAAAVACVTFGPPPPLWTVWGAPSGHVPGQVVHSESSILVSVEKFFIGSSSTFDRARIEPPPVPGFGAGQNARTQYINLGFTFQQLGWTPNRVRFLFHDNSFSSVENLIVNGALYKGPIQAAPAALGGVAVTVGAGVVDLVGPVTSLRVGGQQLWVDELCAAP